MDKVDKATDALGRNLPRVVWGAGVFILILLVFIVLAACGTEEGCSGYRPQQKLACQQLTATALAGH